MLVLFLFIQQGLREQKISIYEIDNINKILHLQRTVLCPFEDLEKTIVDTAQELNTKYINILNDKEMQKDLVEKYNLIGWEDLENDR